MEKATNIDIGVTEFEKLVAFAQANSVDLVVPGPEVPLVAGVSSWFEKGSHPFLKIGLTLQPSRNCLLWSHARGSKT